MARRSRGTAVLVAVPLANLALWAVAAPPGDGRPAQVRQLAGEATGATALLLLAATLVLATRARWLEPFFGGLDRVYRAHRHTGQVATALLILHAAVTPWRLAPGGGVPAGLIAFTGLVLLVALAVGPRMPLLRRVVRISYGAWRRSHRLAGVFFLISAAHVLLADSLAGTSPLWRAILIATLVAGGAAYLYTLLVARFVRPTRRYVVAAVGRLTATAVEVSLRPRRHRRVAYRAGQFVFVRFGRRGLREPHPFTVSSAPADDLLRLTIRAAGDFTGRLPDRLRIGDRATVEGGYGMLDYRRGRPRQVWVAGGIGITPFLSWLRDARQAPDGPAHTVDLCYAVRHRSDALFWDEIEATARRLGWLRAHLHVSSVAGQLTADGVAAAVGGALRDREAYLCGPAPMIRTMSRQLRRHGMPAAAIHYEEASFR